MASWLLSWPPVVCPQGNNLFVLRVVKPPTSSKQKDSVVTME